MDHLARGEKIIIGMVGLPARGKTYVSRKIVRYLTWIGFKCEVFNIGHYRRELYGTKECTASFFDANNAEATKAREQCAMLALNDLIKFLEGGGHVAIYDGTNTTVERRRLVKNALEERLGSHQLMWIESICNDEKIIENNIRLTKLSSPDYKDVDHEIATRDFKNRIAKYSQIYAPLSKENDGDSTSFIKMYDVGRQFEMNRINGYIESKIVSFLLNLHITPRPIYFCRHGESQYNVEDRIGGDPGLTQKGITFAKKLAEFFENELQQEEDDEGQKPDVKIFTSTLRRSIDTSEFLDLGTEPISVKLLDELNAGNCDGMTYQEIAEKFPVEVKERTNDKLTYRYPRGESYLDLIHRIEPIIFEIERSKVPVLVIAHQAVLRCLYAYFSKNEIKAIPYINIPIHTVIKLIPETYFNREFRNAIDVENGLVKTNYVSQPSFLEDFRSVKT